MYKRKRGRRELDRVLDGDGLRIFNAHLELVATGYTSGQ